jgi:hypothetical protein
VKLPLQEKTLRAKTRRKSEGAKKAELLFIVLILRQRSHSFTYQFKRKTLAQQMIEQLLRIGPVLRTAAQTYPLRDCLIDHLFFGRGGEDLIQRLISRGFIDLLQPQIALQSLPANRPLLDAI